MKTKKLLKWLVSGIKFFFNKMLLGTFCGILAIIPIAAVVYIVIMLGISAYHWSFKAIPENPWWYIFAGCIVVLLIGYHVIEHIDGQRFGINDPDRLTKEENRFWGIMSK